MFLWIVYLAGCLLPTGGLASNDAWRWSYFDRSSGLPSDRVLHLAEDAEGTLWAATQGGLAYYDGYRWQSMGPQHGLPLSQPKMLDIAAAGPVWTVVNQRLYRGGRSGFTAVPLVADGRRLTPRQIIALAEDAVLVLTWDGLWRMQDGALAAVDLPVPASQLHAAHLYGGVDGTCWLFVGRVLFRWDGVDWTQHLGHHIVTHLDIAQDNGLAAVSYPLDERGIWEWDGSLRHNASVGNDLTVALDIAPTGDAAVLFESGKVLARRQGQWRPLESLPGSIAKGNALLLRPDGDLWLGTDEGLYLYRYASSRWRHLAYGPEDARDRVNEVVVSSAGDIWLATDRGAVVRRSDGSDELWQEADGIEISILTGLVEDPAGAVWVSSGASFAGACRWDGERWRRYGADSGVYFHKIRRGRDGRLWFLGLGRAGDGPSVFVWDGQRFLPWAEAQGLPHSRVYAFSEAPDGGLWFGTMGGMGRFLEGEWTHWTRAEGLEVDRIFTLDIGADGTVWFADQANGLGRIGSDGRPRYFTRMDGLVHDVVWDVRVDGEGGVWLGTRGGLGLYRDSVWSSLRSESGLGNLLLWPVLPHGDRVYIGTLGSGLSILDLAEAAGPAPVVEIAAPLVEERAALARWRVFPYWGRQAAGQAATRFRLDGGPWSDWNRAREVRFEELAWGGHRFEVQAKGMFGQLGQVAALDFEQPYPEYLNPLFAVPLALLLGALSGGLVWIGRRKRRADTELKDVLRSARCMLWSADVYEREGVFEWNTRFSHQDALRATLGLDEGEDYAKVLLDRMEPATRERMDRTSSEALRQGQDGYRQEFACPAVDGQTLWLAEEVTIEKLARQHWRLTGVCVDITEQKRAQERLAQAQKLESIGQLSAGVAHEINSPMQFIGDNIHFVKDGLEALDGLSEVLDAIRCDAAARKAAPEQVEHLERFLEAAEIDYILAKMPEAIDESLEGVQRVNRIIQAMRIFAHPGSGEFEPVDLNQLVESAVTISRNEWRYVAEVELQVEEGLGQVHCLPNDLSRVVVNLLVNAAHAIEEKNGKDAEAKGTIRVLTRGLGSWVQILVADTGNGIPTEVQPHIFVPFYTTKDVGRGTGQGLAIVHEVVVQGHGGEISFETRAGEGTTFTVSIPRRAPVASVKDADKAV